MDECVSSMASVCRRRFIGFSDDFSTWVFFYGPEGGERNA